ncbi:MAG: TIGR02266 family protein [Myxococcota bacterium]
MATEHTGHGSGDEGPGRAYGEVRVEPIATPAGTSSSGARAGVEMRRHARYRVELDVDFGTEHNFYSGFIENLSAGGVFIATHQVRPIGSLVQFSIQMPTRNRPVRGFGEVRWVREYNEDTGTQPGMGLRFVEISHDDNELIRNFVERRDPIFFDD